MEWWVEWPSTLSNYFIWINIYIAWKINAKDGNANVWTLCWMWRELNAKKSRVRVCVCVSPHWRWHQKERRRKNSLGRLRALFHTRLGCNLLIQCIIWNGDLFRCLLDRTVNTWIHLNATTYGQSAWKRAVTALSPVNRFHFHHCMEINQSRRAQLIFIGVNWEHECASNSNFLIRLNHGRANRQLVDGSANGTSPHNNNIINRNESDWNIGVAAVAEIALNSSRVSWLELKINK